MNTSMPKIAPNIQKDDVYSQTTTVIKYIICHNGQLSSTNGISSCRGEFMGLSCGLKNIISFRNRQSIGNGI